MTGGGDAVGRAVALALAARGVRVVVVGAVERALGETVGEIVYGGGKARHVVADARDAVRVAQAVDRATEVFGGLDLVVAADPEAAARTCVLETVRPRLRERGRSLGLDPAEGSGVEPEKVAERVVALLAG